MTGILIDYARFVEVQQRRACIGAELGQAHETAASRARLASIDEVVEASEPKAGVDARVTRVTVDVR